MRRFRVWIDKQVPGLAPIERVVELADDNSDLGVEVAMDEALTDLVFSEVDSGWEEIT